MSNKQYIALKIFPHFVQVSAWSKSKTRLSSVKLPIFSSSLNQSDFIGVEFKVYRMLCVHICVNTLYSTLESKKSREPGKWRHFFEAPTPSFCISFRKLGRQRSYWRRRGNMFSAVCASSIYSLEVIFIFEVVFIF